MKQSSLIDNLIAFFALQTLPTCLKRKGSGGHDANTLLVDLDAKCTSAPINEEQRPWWNTTGRSWRPLSDRQLDECHVNDTYDGETAVGSHDAWRLRRLLLVTQF